MMQYTKMSLQERNEEYAAVLRQYEAIKAQKLSLNMARGKPSAEQLELSMPMLDVLNSQCRFKASDGTDCRNYGELTGISDAKKLFGDYMGVSEEEIIILGSSSLTFMYDSIARAMLHGVQGSEKPWGKYPKIKFLCPVPGYDRHFSICEFLGIEMINIPMGPEGPDLDTAERLAAEDETIKGIWCVPKFSNPLGVTYSDKIIERLASMQAKAKDFRIFCDNAYAMHYVYDDVPMANQLEACKKAGDPNRVFLFGSTSKITFPGAGVSFFAASKENISFAEAQLSMQAIGWDKLNMLRHVRFLKDIDGIARLMNKHAQILRPRFDIVLEYLEQLAARGIGSYVRPKGGYFVTYLAAKGCAARIVSLCKAAGLILTGAGATHPYGKDPDDSYIRIAPSFPACEELKNAMEIFCAAARLAYLERGDDYGHR